MQTPVSELLILVVKIIATYIIHLNSVHCSVNKTNHRGQDKSDLKGIKMMMCSIPISTLGD